MEAIATKANGDFCDWDTATLRQELVNELGWTAERMRRLAAIWVELERRGEDLSALRSGLPYYLPLIASGAVVAEAVVQFAGSQELLRFVTSLPPEEQRRLAAGGNVPVAVLTNGKSDAIMLPIHALTRVQRKQVFGERCVRSLPEQNAILRTPPAITGKNAATARMGKVVVDRVAGIVRIGRTLAPIDDVLGALRAAGHIS